MMQIRKCHRNQILPTLPQIFIVRHAHSNTGIRMNREEHHECSSRDLCMLVELLLAGLLGALSKSTTRS